ncbi:uncharacterized protein IWZ02DRAFT_434152 [Phyllosticta citriasiana]|uniref:DUF7626 domain-containing protein n=1 Tax=Phyllosticta citriasiana TaxID=595635 RepID=A0ABR1KQK5_9PEZI
MDHNYLYPSFLYNHGPLPSTSLLHMKPPKLTADSPQHQSGETDPERALRTANLHVMDDFTSGRRPITDVLDKLDQKILEYKAQNFGDTQIAKILAEEEGSEYSPKTIGTRYRRIRLAKMAANDAPLQFKEKHWTMQEDEALIKAHNINKKRHERELAQVNARIFEDTAFTLNDLSNQTFHSAKACENRLEELLSGRAQPHPDDDDDPRRPFRDRVEGLAAKWAQQFEEQMQDLEDGEDEMDRLYLGKRASRAKKMVLKRE